MHIDIKRYAFFLYNVMHSSSRTHLKCTINLTETKHNSRSISLEITFSEHINNNNNNNIIGSLYIYKLCDKSQYIIYVEYIF